MSDHQQMSRWERARYHIIGGGFIVIYLGTMFATAMMGLAAVNGPLGAGRYVFLGLVLLLLALSIIGLPLFFMWDYRWAKKRGVALDAPPAPRPRPSGRELMFRFVLGTAGMTLLAVWLKLLWLLPFYVGLWAVWFLWEYMQNRRKRGPAN